MGRGIYLQTQSFTVIEVVRLINVLIIKFNCKCTIHYRADKKIEYFLVLFILVVALFGNYVQNY